MAACTGAHKSQTKPTQSAPAGSLAALLRSPATRGRPPNPTMDGISTPPTHVCCQPAESATTAAPVNGEGRQVAHGPHNSVANIQYPCV